MNNKCLHCGEKLIGRVDKRFCDDQCRNTWHNSNPNHLIELGFSFKFYTNTFTTKNKNTYKLCYDYGYLLLDNNKVLIINRQEYM